MSVSGLETYGTHGLLQISTVDSLNFTLIDKRTVNFTPNSNGSYDSYKFQIAAKAPIVFVRSVGNFIQQGVLPLSSTDFNNWVITITGRNTAVAGQLVTIYTFEQGSLSSGTSGLEFYNDAGARVFSANDKMLKIVGFTQIPDFIRDPQQVSEQYLVPANGTKYGSMTLDPAKTYAVSMNSHRWVEGSVSAFPTLHSTDFAYVDNTQAYVQWGDGGVWQYAGSAVYVGRTSNVGAGSQYRLNGGIFMIADVTYY